MQVRRFRRPTAPAVVHLAAEYWPLARTGGLGEAVAGLAAAQARDLATTVVVPLYRSIRRAGVELTPLGPAFTVRVGPREETGRLWEVVGGSAGPRVVLVQHEGFFGRRGIYGDGNGNDDYADNPRRFAFLTLAALRALPALAPHPLVLHAHDWHTALAPVFMRTALSTDPRYAAIATVLTVHNAGFQGHFPFESLCDVGLPTELYDWRRLEWYGRVNWLKGGLAFTDVATTVSPTHAQELRTETGGFGLHAAFVGLGDRFLGVLNGIADELWHPGRNGNLEHPYSVHELSGKALAKSALQRAYGLHTRADVPVVAMSARLVAQKGFDVLLASRLIRTTEAQFVFLGTGEARYRHALAELADSAPHRIATDFEYSDGREHRLLAGADMLLMPSLYEPCGLTQMRAQRYGLLPVARRVGGLADTITDEETGFLFDEYTPEALDGALARALGRYGQRDAWRANVRLAMTRDFSWSASAERYREVYDRALAERTCHVPRRAGIASRPHVQRAGPGSTGADGYLVKPFRFGALLNTS